MSSSWRHGFASRVHGVCALSPRRRVHARRHVPDHGASVAVTSCMTRMRYYHHVLLDVDGTLVDSNDAHSRAWIAAFAERGFDVDPAHVRRLIGMGGDRLIPAAIGLEE